MGQVAVSSGIASGWGLEWGSGGPGPDGVTSQPCFPRLSCKMETPIPPVLSSLHEHLQQRCEQAETVSPGLGHPYSMGVRAGSSGPVG